MSEQQPSKMDYQGLNMPTVNQLVQKLYAVSPSRSPSLPRVWGLGLE